MNLLHHAAIHRVATLLLLFLPSGSFAQRDSIKEQAIEQQLHAIAPQWVDEFHQATIALDNGYYMLADSLYSRVLENAPNFDVVYRRMGAVRYGQGRSEEAVALCRQAIALKRSFENIFVLAQHLITSAENKASSLEEALVLLEEASFMSSADEFEILVLKGTIALESNNLQLLQTVTGKLNDAYDERMQTHYFAAILAASTGDVTGAKREIRRANELGFPDEGMHAFIEDLETNVEAGSYGVFDQQGNTGNWGMLGTVLWITLFWAIGFVLLFIIGRILSAITLRTIEKQLAQGDLQSGSKLRRFYKTLITISGFYYYISLPVILVLVLFIGGGAIYAFFALGHIPIKLVVILVILIGGTIYGMVRSLFIRPSGVEPGRILKPEEAPRLYALTKQVADEMGTRPIDEIRITHDTDLAVYETGTWREKMNDAGKRILIIGTAVIQDFRVNDFRAVLAHEYGHFTNRDTAGGGVAMRVQRDMTNYYVALYNAGVATWYNIAFQFLRFYNFLFRRISAGATRLQEVLADQVAAKMYGEVAFTNGLTFVVRRSIEFSESTDLEIRQAEMEKRPYNNLYGLTPASESDIEKQVEQALNRPTTEDDTHPSPVDRFRYIKGVGVGREKADEGSISDYFEDWAALTDEMTQLVRKIVDHNRRLQMSGN